MNTLFLHVGLHKSATTYLQRSVFPQFKQLCYLGKGNNSPRLTPEKLAQSMPLERDALYSDESLTGSLRACYRTESKSWLDVCRNTLCTYRDELQETGSTLKAIVSFRLPVAWASSIYKHYLKYGGVDRPEIFFGIGSAARATIPLGDLSLSLRLKAVEDIVDPVPFCFFIEELDTHPDALARDLQRFLGCEQEIIFPGSRFNEGLSKLDAALCRAFNNIWANPRARESGRLDRCSKRGYKLSQKIINRPPFSYNRKPLVLPKEVTDAIDAYCHDDILDVMRRIEASPHTYRSLYHLDNLIARR